MSTFILNDLDDLEKDKINHSDRPLPRGQVTPTFVVTLYYICLALALITTRLYVGRAESAFLYYVGFSACISYRYVVEYLTLLKPLYVAGTTTIPILILITYSPSESLHLEPIAIALFLAMLGRELCKDLPDRPGDPISAIHKINPRIVARAAFALQAAALLILCCVIGDALSAVIILAMLLILLSAYVYWNNRRYPVALALMKLVVLFGLYFLL
jgi:geranylgeranylglycerol-phosphate geranylgeranyltransferase